MQKIYYAADLYINSVGRADGDIVISGTWYISCSMSNIQSQCILLMIIVDIQDGH